MTPKRIDNLKKMVEAFLRDYEDLRNCDVKLQMALLKHKFPHAFKQSVDGNEYVAIWALSRITQDNVKRIRAKIQNEDGLYLPSDPEVRKHRKIKEEQWNQWLISQRPAVKYWNDTDDD